MNYKLTLFIIILGYCYFLRFDIVKNKVIKIGIKLTIKLNIYLEILMLLVIL